MEVYAEKHEDLAHLDRQKAWLEEDPEKEMVKKCKTCKKDCKVLVNVGTDPKTYNIICEKETK
jgi:hypothetical protein